MLLMPAFGRLRQEDCEFEASLGYTVRLSHKAKQNKTKPAYGEIFIQAIS